LSSESAFCCTGQGYGRKSGRLLASGGSFHPIQKPALRRQTERRRVSAKLNREMALKVASDEADSYLADVFWDDWNTTP
jgi:hypothetical protein